MSSASRFERFSPPIEYTSSPSGLLAVKLGNTTSLELPHLPGWQCSEVFRWNSCFIQSLRMPLCTPATIVHQSVTRHDFVKCFRTFGDPNLGSLRAKTNDLSEQDRTLT